MMPYFRQGSLMFSINSLRIAVSNVLFVLFTINIFYLVGWVLPLLKHVLKHIFPKSLSLKKIKKLEPFR